MNQTERSVLRRKVYLLKAILPLNKKVYDECQRQGLLDAGQIKRIQATQSDHEAYMTFIVCLEERNHATFDKLCYFLERMGSSEAADELQAELLLQKGELAGVAHLPMEADCLYNKHFNAADNSPGVTGVTGGHSETEFKGKITELMIDRYLVGRETWMRQHNRKRQQLGREKNDIAGRVDASCQMLRAILDEQAGLIGVNIDWPEMAGDSESGRSYQQAFARLQKYLDKLSQVMSEMGEKQQDRDKEIKICYRMMGMSTDTNIPLQECLEAYIVRTHGELDHTKHALNNKTDAAKHMDSQIYKLQTDMNSKLQVKQLVLQSLTNRLAEREGKMKTLEEKLKSISHDDDVLKAQVSYWKERCTLLEKTRRLGYKDVSLDPRKAKGKTFEEIKAMGNVKYEEYNAIKIPGLKPADSVSTASTSTWNSATISPASLRGKEGIKKKPSSKDWK